MVRLVRRPNICIGSLAVGSSYVLALSSPLPPHAARKEGAVARDDDLIKFIR